MKLRIRGNSLRLRLLRGEVRRLVETGAVEERTDIGPGGRAFVYAVRVDDTNTGVSASFTGDQIIIHLSRTVARDWSLSDRVGIEASQPTSGGDVLRILIEKDFECLNAPPHESQDDAYPHPQGNKC